MSSNESISHYVDARAADSGRLDVGVPSWLIAYRRAALKRFSAAGLPDIRDEDWKYTDTRAILKQQFVPVGGDDQMAPDRPLPAPLAGDGAPRIVISNGRVASRAGALPAGLRIESLADLIDQDSRELHGYLGNRVPADAHGFVHLNGAFVADGVALFVEPGQRVETPVELLFVNGGAQVPLIQPRSIVVCGENAGLTVVERHVGSDGSEYLNNSVMEVSVARGASLELVKLQEEGDAGYHVGAVYARCERDARFVHHNYALGGRIARTDLAVSLDGSGAHAGLFGLYMAVDRQHVDNHTEVDHAEPDAVSDELYKGVLDDRGRVVFHGRIKVQPDAQRTNAYQNNRNLLLSDRAEVDSKPQLEIYADDVRCSHGATVGQLDAEPLFYLRSRGLAEIEARKAMTFAFLNDVLARCPVAGVQDHVQSVLARRIERVSS